MKWMRERDLLIAQTMAFVQSVTGKKPDADMLFTNSAALTAGEASKPASIMPGLEALLADTTVAVTPPKPVEIARPDIRIDFQTEIRARVANFRQMHVAAVFARARRRPKRRWPRRPPAGRP